MNLTKTIDAEYEKVEETKVKALKNNYSVDGIIKSFENALEEGKRNYLLTSSNFLDKREESIRKRKENEAKAEEENYENDPFFDEFFIPFILDPFSQEDITHFSLAAREYSTYESFEEVTGIFLTELIMFHDEKFRSKKNSSNEIQNNFNEIQNNPNEIQDSSNKIPIEKDRSITEYVLITTGYTDLCYLGSELTGQTIKVIGDGGSNVGYGMHSGKIIIEGNVKEDVGSYMLGGELIIQKNAGPGLGNLMNNGKIIVYGNADENCGYSMKEGLILIKGNSERHTGSFMQNGKIIVEGNTASYAGQEMQGGCLLIKGDTGIYLGKEMTGGKISVHGKTGRYPGLRMKGGHIYMHGNSSEKRTYASFQNTLTIHKK